MGFGKFCKIISALHDNSEISEILTTQAINIALLLGNWNSQYLIADYLVWLKDFANDLYSRDRRLDSALHTLVRTCCLVSSLSAYTYETTFGMDTPIYNALNGEDDIQGLL